MSKAFYTHKQPNSALRSLTLDGYGEISRHSTPLADKVIGLTEKTLRTWSEFVDLSQLTSLKSSGGAADISYFNYAPTVLTSLKHVSLDLSRHDDSLKQAVEIYITTCAPLESLSLWSWHGVISLSSILEVHGPTLKTLQLHERETTGTHGESMRKLLTVEEVKQISIACPNLKDMTFDLDRHTRALDSELEEDASIFNLVANMTLNKLQIYYDLGLSSLARPDGFMTPAPPSEEAENADGQVMDDPLQTNAKVQVKTKTPPLLRPLSPTPNQPISDFAASLWKKVFGDTRAGSRILALKFGEWEREIGSGYPAHWV